MGQPPLPWPPPPWPQIENQSVRSTAGLCDWNSKWDQPCETEPLTCGVSSNSRYLGSDWFELLDTQLVLEIWLWKKSLIWCQKKVLLQGHKWCLYEHKQCYTLKEYGARGNSKAPHQPCEFRWGKLQNALVLSHIWLCDTLDCSPPGSSVPEIFQARIWEWVPISSSRGSSWPSVRTCVSFVSCIARRFFTQWAAGERKVWKVLPVLMCGSEAL